MAIQNLGVPLWLPPFPLQISSVPSFTTNQFLIDAADEGAALCFQAPATGNIAKVGWGSRTTTTGATIDVRIETIDATTGFPSGTLFATNTNGAQVVAGSDDNVSFLTTLTAVAAVTKGDYIAVVIKQPNTSFGNMQVAGLADADPLNYPFSALNTGTSPAVSWARPASGMLDIWLEYDTGAYYYIPEVFPVKDTMTSTALSTSTTPDVMGLRFSVPIGARLSHAWVWLDADGDYKVMLVSNAYNQGAGTGILATATIDKDIDASTAAILSRFTFPVPYDLVAGTTYRLVIEPTTATSLAFYDFNLASLAAMDAWGGQNLCLTSAKDPTQDSDWTNYNSGTFRKPFMGLGLSGFDSGGGLLTHPGMAGGMRG